MNTRHQSLALYFARAFPARTATMITLMILAGLAEGVSLISLLPLLQLVADSQVEPSGAARSIATVLGWIGLKPQLIHLLPLVVAGITLKALCLWFAMRQVGYTVARVATELRLDLIENMLHARWHHFTGRPKGQLANAISTEAQRASAAYRDVCTMFAKGVQVLMYAVLAVFVSWQAALIALGAGLGLLVLLKGFLSLSRAAGQMQTAAMTSLSSRLVDALQGIKSVKAMGAEANLLQLLRQDAEDLNRSHQRLVTAAETLKLLQEPLVATLVALGLWLTLIVIRMPFADAIVLALLFYRLMGQTTTMQQHYVGVTGGESAFWSIRGEIDAAHREREQMRGELTAPPLTESCEFDHVSFSYNGQPILRDLSLTIRAGQFVAIVGASGAGKTTLADLLLGLHIPESGQILIDRIPLSAIHIQSWRSQIGYVPQDTTLFHDTVFANVTLGDSRFDETDVQDALRSADAWSFVESRPDGIYAIVGEQGMALSGGQRQRIAIARALIRRPRLLVLDEATTALDPETEMQICQTLRKLKGDLTIVAISHQSGLQQVADSVYRLEPGRIVSIGLEHATA